MLCANVALNTLDNVVCHHAVADEANGRITMPKLPDPATRRNWGHMPVTTAEAGDEVKVITIDSLKLERCNLIKIDVEGMETRVLAGARKTIKRCGPILYVECGDEPAGKIADTLEDIGYRAWWSVYPYFDPGNYNGNLNFIWEEETMPSANLLCAPIKSGIELRNDQFRGKNDSWRKSMERVLKQRAA
jgi:FkbM family methyltransferase